MLQLHRKIGSSPSVGRPLLPQCHSNEIRTNILRIREVSRSHLANSLLFLSCFGCRSQCEGGGRSNYEFGHNSLFPSQQLQAQQGDTWEEQIWAEIALFPTVMFLLTLPASNSGVVLKVKQIQLCWKCPHKLSFLCSKAVPSPAGWPQGDHWGIYLPNPAPLKSSLASQCSQIYQVCVSLSLRPLLIIACC